MAFRSQSSLPSVVIPEGTDLILHRRFTKEELEEIHDFFMQQPEQKLNYDDLRQLLVRYNLNLNDHEYRILFNKLNIDRDLEHVAWNEFISYLILCYEGTDDTCREESLLEPIEGPPFVVNTGQRDRIVCMFETGYLTPDWIVEKGSEGYCTLTKNGIMNVWTNQLELYRIREAKNPHLKISKTCILSVIVLFDVRIMCTSATERDLRFYDISLNNFYLRMHITNLPNPVYTTHYYSAPSIDQNCKLILGDSSGTLRLLEFSAKGRGPFASQLKSPLIELTWAQVRKGRLLNVVIREYPHIHNNIVRQIQYSSHLNSIFSIAECYDSNDCAGMVETDLGVVQSKAKFYAPKGFSTFFLDDEHIVIATGGPDCLVRIWNPLVPQKPIGILSGHNAGIAYVFIQRDENMLYSIDHLKVINVWALPEQLLLQTFMGLQDVIPSSIPCTYHYNHETHDLLIGAKNLVRLKCRPRIDLDEIDGETHAGPVSVVLYNTLFRKIVCCGLDGFITVWNPRTGRRRKLLKNAHVEVVEGKTKHIPILSACFNHLQQYVLTGAANGTLKIWNVNNGDCVRNLRIGIRSELTAVFWIPDRILVIGWNRYVTEFSDIKGEEYSDGQAWPILHNANITTAAMREPDAFVTGCQAGTLTFWKLETGQAYRQNNIYTPEENIKLKQHHLKSLVSFKDLENMNAGKTTSQKVGHSIKPIKAMIFLKTRPCSKEHVPYSPMWGHGALTQPFIGNFESTLHWLHSANGKYSRKVLLQLDSQCALRPFSGERGTLLVSLETGNIQVYSHHTLGGFMHEFKAIHMPGDYVVTMATDKLDRYLFTATAFGYIKTWLMTNFCMPESEEKKVSMPKLRLRFPFLLVDRFRGRAKKRAAGQMPILLNSFRAHLKPILSLVYIDVSHILVSGSADKSTRLWSLGGRYLGTFGTSLPWRRLSLNEPVSETEKFRMPPDIAKCASSTTLKVLTGADPKPFVKFDAKLQNETGDMSLNSAEQAKLAEMESKGIYGKPLPEPILGKNFKIPTEIRPRLKPTLDTSLPYIPVYTHLDLHGTTTIEKPPMPEALKNLREMKATNEEWDIV